MNLCDNTNASSIYISACMCTRERRGEEVESPAGPLSLSHVNAHASEDLSCRDGGEAYVYSYTYTCASASRVNARRRTDKSARARNYFIARAL